MKGPPSRGLHNAAVLLHSSTGDALEGVQDPQLSRPLVQRARRPKTKPHLTTHRTEKISRGHLLAGFGPDSADLFAHGLHLSRLPQREGTVTAKPCLMEPPHVQPHSSSAVALTSSDAGGQEQLQVKWLPRVMENPQLSPHKAPLQRRCQANHQTLPQGQVKRPSRCLLRALWQPQQWSDGSGTPMFLPSCSSTDTGITVTRRDMARG